MGVERSEAGDQGAVDDRVEKFGGLGSDVDGVLNHGREEQRFVGLGPRSGADLILVRAEFLAFAFLRSIAEPEAPHP